MRSSEVRFIMEQYLEEFLLARPDAISMGRHPEISPIFAMGISHGLTIQTACHYLRWLADNNKIDGAQSRGILGVISATAEMLNIELTKDMFGPEPWPAIFT